MKTLVTHSGSFHQDELFAIATLLLIFGDEIKIVRTRDSALIEKADYAIDVSGINDPKKGRFDHHQEGGAGQRANGIPTPVSVSYGKNTDIDSPRTLVSRILSTKN
jgi:uncharacterized UPF0160 family protein